MTLLSYAKKDKLKKYFEQFKILFNDSNKPHSLFILIYL